MLPNMERVLIKKEQDITLTVVTQVIVGVTTQLTEVDTPIRAVVQVASDEILKALNIDYSQSIYQVHIRQSLLDASSIDIKTIDKIKNYKGQEFKVTRPKNYSEYGYREFICEEIKS